MSYPGIIIAVQANGERIRYETWVYEYWIRGMLFDPLLARHLDSAVSFHHPF